MSQIIIYTIITLVAIGATAAIILYFVAQKFKVYEDPRIDEVEEALPASTRSKKRYLQQIAADADFPAVGILQKRL